MKTFKETYKGYWYFDKYGACLRKPTHQGDRPEHDSIGRSFRAWIAWKHHMFAYFIFDCIDAKSIIWRHHYYKNKKLNNISRDHVLYFFLTYIITKFPKNQIKNLHAKLKWNLSDKHTQRGLYSYLQALTGNKFCEIFWYTYMIPLTFLQMFWQKIIYYIYDLKPIPQGRFKQIPNNEKPKLLNILLKPCLPVYALHHLGWQLTFLQNTWAKKKMQWIGRQMTDETNKVIKMLMGKKYTETQINWMYAYYEPMAGNWWTTSHVPLVNDRHVYILKQGIKHNLLDKDYMLGVWEFLNKKNTHENKI